MVAMSDGQAMATVVAAWGLVAMLILGFLCYDSERWACCLSVSDVHFFCVFCFLCFQGRRLTHNLIKLLYSTL